jgi:hypothetical protein
VGPSLDLNTVDWHRPWFVAWRQTGERVAAATATGLPLAQALDAQDSAPIRFTGPDLLPQGQAYETHIFTNRTCPTRENLHDFFNGLAWLNFPLAKSRLNELQAREIAQRGIGGMRGPVRDAITLFDENGAVLCAPPPLWEALRARDWRRLFVEQRSLWRDARLLVFGHALLEKLAQPRKDLTAHLLDACAPATPLPALDAWLAAQLTEDRMAQKPFVPLPVLGVPGWCAENENLSFYDDARVFRPPAAPGP